MTIGLLVKSVGHLQWVDLVGLTSYMAGVVGMHVCSLHILLMIVVDVNQTKPY